ncbi:MauE/DoxX family redox-associated membrane protein [Nocardioides bigeumensis]|uniref:Methylamine utilisation protein MauE domain-containing protein n=1 Tax=Nocardioides bigeumensis TaxID=433657 RepID=A0ABN2YI82_9ACTN
MSGSLVLVDLVLAAVLLLSGAAKLGDRRTTEDMFVSLRVPLVPRAVGARLLPWGELLLGLLLLVAPPVLLVVTAALVLALFLAYLALIARATRFDPPVTCACFGKLGGHRVGATTVVRNALLVALAGVALAGALDGHWLPGGVTDLDRGGVAWLFTALATAALAWLIGRSDTPPGAADEELDYLRLEIPYGVLRDAAGVTQSLRELAATRARILFFLSPGCGACERTAQRLDEWSAAFAGRVAVHAVYTAPLEALPDPPHDPALSFHEPEQNVTRTFGMLTTPSAVVLGTDGLLAGGPVIGESAVADMVGELLEELAGTASEPSPESAQESSAPVS